MFGSDQQDCAHLPAAVYDLAMRLGVKPESRCSRVRLTQTGRMLRSLGSTSRKSFSANQTISVDDCAFTWQARFGPFSVISVRDALENDQGCLDVRALCFIPIMHTPRTTALTRGELMRYLAEIALAPDAILRNKTLRWRVEAPDALAVSAGIGDTAAEVLLTLNNEGRIIGTFAPDRPPPLSCRPLGAAVYPTTASTREGGYHSSPKSPGRSTASQKLIGRARCCIGPRSAAPHDWVFFEGAHSL
jgi:hypothetical protein